MFTEKVTLVGLFLPFPCFNTVVQEALRWRRYSPFTPILPIHTQPLWSTLHSECQEAMNLAQYPILQMIITIL